MRWSMGAVAGLAVAGLMAAGLMTAGLMTAGLMTAGCDSSESGEDVADVVADAAPEVVADVASDVPEGARVYAGNIVFRVDNITCNVPISVTWDGESFPDADAYAAGTPEAERCKVEVAPGVSVPFDQVTLKFGRHDPIDDRLKGGLVVQYTQGSQTTTTLSWEGAVPSPATGFQSHTVQLFANFTSIGWHIPAI